MADEEHLRILRSGVDAWNSWRRQNPATVPDLSVVNLSGADLAGANLSGADLSGVDLRKAVLGIADLRRANLTKARLESAELGSAHLDEAILTEANLRFASLGNAKLPNARLDGAILSAALLFMVDLTYANLTGARMINANLTGADLRHSVLRYAILEGAILVGAKLEDADLRDASVYGVSAWNLTTNDGTRQENLVITPVDETQITADDLEVAQFLYLLLNNQKIRNVIDTIGKKGVLILGRFTEERKAVLDAIRAKLRELGFVPMMFDFAKPTQRDFTETIKTLAGLSRFMIADITNPRSSPLELQATMPDYMIPFVPIIQEHEEPFAMFRDLQQKYGGWVLDVLKYDSAENLVAVLEKAVVGPALEKGKELLAKKTEEIRFRYVRDFT